MGGTAREIHAMPDPEKPEPTPTPAPPSADWLSLARTAARAASSFLRPEPRPPAGDEAEPGAGSAELPRVVSPDTLRDERIPRGQVRTRKWPVLHAGPTPQVDLKTWDLRCFGAVDRPVTWTWDEFRALPAAVVAADMHCVTHWSRLDNAWQGVLVRDLIRHVGPRPEARFVLIHAEGGFTTNLPIDEFQAEDCLFAWSHDGRALDRDHGWPLRLVVPRLYAWKSAKWVRGVEFLEADRPGFWEQNGYHNHGDPWKLNSRGTDSAERYW